MAIAFHTLNAPTKPHRSITDADGATSTELSFMLASTLKIGWPQQYIEYLEDKMVFNSEDEVHPTAGSAWCGATSTAPEGAGSELVVWKGAETTASRAVH